jgi:hypothetical protein
MSRSLFTEISRRNIFTRWVRKKQSNKINILLDHHKGGSVSVEVSQLSEIFSTAAALAINSLKIGISLRKFVSAKAVDQSRLHDTHRARWIFYESARSENNNEIKRTCAWACDRSAREPSLLRSCRSAMNKPAPLVTRPKELLIAHPSLRTDNASSKYLCIRTPHVS